MATIVMVLVLAVSLTTATYAWFTVTNVTTIDAFEISVVAGNAVNVGVKTNNTYAETVTANDFMNGQVVYEPGTPGVIGGGTWTNGVTGLGARIDHDIAWGAQSAAVGVTSETLTEKAGQAGYWTGATTTNTTTWTAGTVIAANAAAQGDTALTNVTKAMANKNGTRYTETDGVTFGDYAYLYIGASPTKALKSSSLVIMIEADQTKGAIVGILSSIHVAYRLNGGTGASGNTPGTWKDVQLCGSVRYDQLLNDITMDWTGENAAIKNAYEQSYTGKLAPTKGAWFIEIDGLTTTQGQIDQIEIVIYIAGADDDCRDEAKGAAGSISIFFVTEEQTA